MPSPDSREAELDRARAVYAARDADADVAWTWSPDNPAAVAMRRQRDDALRSLFARAGIDDFSQLSVADFGCGDGEFIGWLVSLGLDPARAYGIDLSDARVAKARVRVPDATLAVGSADATGLPARSVDVVCQMTLLSSVHSSDLRTSIAAEMDRVLVPGGRVVWFDVRPTTMTLRAVLGLKRAAWWLVRGLWRGEPLRRATTNTLVRLSRADVEQLFPRYAAVGGAAVVGQDVVRASSRVGRLLLAACTLVPGLRGNLALVLRKPSEVDAA